MLGVVSQPPETFPTAQGKEFKQTPPFMDQHHFSTTKTRPLPPKNQSSNPLAPKIKTLRLVGRIGGIRITGLHLGPKRERQRFSQWSLQKQPVKLCTHFSISKYFGWGGVFGRFPGNTFLGNYQFGGSEIFDGWRLYFVLEF